MDGITSARRRTVLLVEDDANVRRSVASYLSDRNVQVASVAGLTAARDLLNGHHFDAVLLDLNLGSEDGLTLAREIGERGAPPLLIISSRATETDRIVGLEIGADDYLVKPFGFGELHARLRVVWRRSDARRHPRRTHARFAHWCADLSNHRLQSSGGHDTKLTAGETSLLRAFLEHPRVALTRGDLLHLTDHSDVEVFERVIDVLVARVRRKLENGAELPDLIETVRGRGYRLNASVTWEDLSESEGPS
jgi:two-component system OmpR family response regulator